MTSQMLEQLIPGDIVKCNVSCGYNIIKFVGQYIGRHHKYGGANFAAVLGPKRQRDVYVDIPLFGTSYIHLSKYKLLQHSIYACVSWEIERIYVTR